MGLAIDDFGAGYATFSLLNKWGWDVVKIDKSLITADDEQSRLLFSNVVRTLRELGLSTVAEGIETPGAAARGPTCGGHPDPGSPGQRTGRDGRSCCVAWGRAATPWPPASSRCREPATGRLLG